VPYRIKVRHDGWTLDRQAVFLGVLIHCRSVSRAAAAAGMSREGAYRLRARNPLGDFAQAWDRALRLRHRPASVDEGHRADSRGGGVEDRKVTGSAPDKVTRITTSPQIRRGINTVNFATPPKPATRLPIGANRRP
jgi:hypothetical protein